MERTIEHGDLHTLQFVSGQRTGFDGLLEAFFDRRDEFLRNVTSLDLGNKFQTGLSFAVGFHAEDHIGKLTTTTRLLLVHLAVFDSTGERFLVSHLRLTFVHLDVEFAFETVHDDLQVQFAHTRDDRLARILVRVYAEGRVFLGQFRQTYPQLI